MCIYTFNSIDNLLSKLGICNLSAVSRKPHIRDNYPEIYKDIVESTKFLIEPTFPERLYCYVNKLSMRPLCKMCTNEVRYSTSKDRDYFVYCSGRCAMKDMPSKLGVKNTSQLKSVKDKKKQSAQEKYGVDNVSKSQEIKDMISVSNKKAWEKKLQILIDSTRDTYMTLSKKEYYRLVWKITEWMYCKYINILDPGLQRSQQYQLDHMVSICYGFQNKIPPDIVGDINNLEIVTSITNNRKNYRNSVPIESLYEKYNKFYLDNSIPPITEIYKKKKPELKVIYHEVSAGQCLYCKIDAHYQIGRRETWCCSSSPNSCPANRNKNSSKQLSSEKKKVATSRRKLQLTDKNI